MRYQLQHLLVQVRHRKASQIQEQGQVEEWVFPLERALVQALEMLELPQGQGARQDLVALEEQVEVLGPQEDWHLLQFESQRKFGM